MLTIDANSAVANIAYKTNEVIAIYPITPSSSMAEQCYSWSEQQRRNILGDVPQVIEMQSEGGAIATVHGALQTGSLATSFTSSQGLLLMIPTLYKLAGELTPFVLHVAARTVAAHALSIFGDHSDVMAVRQTGCAMLCSSSVQEAQDFALIAQLATLRSRIPFIHFFDGFRTSHEINKITPISDDILRTLFPASDVQAHRQRALTPDAPVIRGTAANPDTFFQAREAANSYYNRALDHIEQVMAEFEQITGRSYKPFEYYGHPNAERVIILMGSGCGACEEVVDHLLKQGERAGFIKVRVYRPFSAAHLLAVLPHSVRQIAVLDRTKEAGSMAEPLFLDVMAALTEAYQSGGRVTLPKMVGGRYGLSSKEFDPDCVHAIFKELNAAKPRSRFTVGITDDITHLSLPLTAMQQLNTAHLEALFYGLGSDGTVSAAKNNIKIMGDNTEKHAQGYFVYDSKKAGGLTVSHLRVSDYPIKSPYLIQHADFIGCHQMQFLEKYEIAEKLKAGGVFLLNSPYSTDKVWHYLPQEVQLVLIQKKAQLYVVNAAKLAREHQLGARINTVMQMAFFALTDILPTDTAALYLRQAIEKSYSSKGLAVVERNQKVLIATLSAIEKVEIQPLDNTSCCKPAVVSEKAPDFVKTVTAIMLAGKGDSLPVSAFPPDGTWPVGTAQWEKRNIADTIPIWHADACTQCNYCVAACPHSAIRAKVVMPEALNNAPESLSTLDVKARDMRGMKYVLQVAPEDCTGCNLCVAVCPAKDRKQPELKAINMRNRLEHLEQERQQFDYFRSLPDIDPSSIERIDIRTSQLITPLFEYSGACSGCGETPYIKLLTQLFGDRLMIANATGCSSIYGGNLPTTPYTTDQSGRGPAWANSLFEDNAEFGLGYRLSVDQHKLRAIRLLEQLKEQLPGELTDRVHAADILVNDRRTLITQIKAHLAVIKNPLAEELTQVIDYLVDKSVWLMGGDGWAYDIGFGGLDHVLSQNTNVNVLVLDTQCYSNTGGQQSKATPFGAITKFGDNGKRKVKKDLGITMMMYGHVYVAQISLGAQMNKTVKALQEAEAYPGPSLVIAYSPCEEHGYDLATSHDQMKALTAGGFWPLYRFNPANAQNDKPALTLDSKTTDGSLITAIMNERRFSRLFDEQPESAEQIKLSMEDAAKQKHAFLAHLAAKAAE